MKVLENSIRTECHHAKVLSKRVDKTEPLLDRLQQPDDPHAVCDTLKICFGTPKIMYTLRTVKPSPSITKVLLHSDNAQRDRLETLIKGNAKCSNWKQANLPINLGGLSSEMLK